MHCRALLGDSDSGSFVRCLNCGLAKLTAPLEGRGFAGYPTVRSPGVTTEQGIHQWNFKLRRSRRLVELVYALLIEISI